MARKWKVRKWRWAEDGHPTTTSSAQHKNTVKSEREREREIQSDRERERERKRERKPPKSKPSHVGQRVVFLS